MGETEPTPQEISLFREIVAGQAPLPEDDQKQIEALNEELASPDFKRPPVPEWQSLTPVDKAVAVGRLASLGVIKPRAAAPGYALDYDKFAYLEPNSPVIEVEMIQSMRLALHRQKLLASGALDLWQIGVGRETSKRRAAAWVDAQTEQNHLFKVYNDGKIIVPQLLFDEELQPIAEQNETLTKFIKFARDIRVGAWATWTMLDSQSSWLGGKRFYDFIVSPDESVRERAAEAIDRINSNYLIVDRIHNFDS